MRESLRRIWAVAEIFIRHGIESAIVIGIVWGLEQLVHFLWGNEEKILFNVLPMRFLFDAMDAIILAMFLVWSLKDVWRLTTTLQD